MDRANLIHSGEPRIAMDSLKTKARWQNMALPDHGSTADRYDKKRSAICDRLRKEFESKVLSLYEAEPSILIIPPYVKCGLPEGATLVSLCEASSIQHVSTRKLWIGSACLHIWRVD